LVEGEVLIDDNFGEVDRGVRVMASADEFSWHRGFFNSLKPRRPGEATITVSDSYENWYDIRCRVGPEAE
jgi:hypothetical protein